MKKVTGFILSKNCCKLELFENKLFLIVIRGR